MGPKTPPGAIPGKAMSLEAIAAGESPASNGINGLDGKSKLQVDTSKKVLDSVKVRFYRGEEFCDLMASLIVFPDG